MISFSLITKTFNIVGVGRWCRGTRNNGFERIDGISLSSKKYIMLHENQRDMFYSFYTKSGCAVGFESLKELNFIHINSKYKKDLI